MIGSSSSNLTSGLFGMPGSHTNPYFNATQQYTPRKLKELFKFCEYLFNNSPHIYSALRKFGEYPITTLTYGTENKLLKNQYKNLMEKTLRSREQLIQATLDKYIYGNSFISMYQPFVRFLECPTCGSRTNIKGIAYKYNVKRLEFSYTCTACKKKVKAGTNNIKDKKILVGSKVNFIKWSPKDMDVDHNIITGESAYYYTIPQALKQQIHQGHKSLIDTIPLGFLKAVKDNKKFKFAPDAIFHMKTQGPSGLPQQWGLPPLLSVMSKFHYTEILRRANEAIALDYLNPLRVLHPAQATGNADPIVASSMHKWKASMTTNLEKWRKDPLHIMLSPFPVGETQVGGNGRALLTLGEVQEAEKSIVAALGIPMEFLYGGLTGTGMEATLRLIENQLETHINDLLDLLQWMADKSGSFMGWDKIEVGMTKFKIVDDANAKNMLYQLWQQGKAGQGEAVISDDTMANLYDIDMVQERAKIEQETLDSARRQANLQRKLTALQQSLAEQARQEAQSNAPQGGYDQQQIISNADGIVEQLMGTDEGSKKSMLHQLQTEDYVLYSVVVQRLEQQKLTGGRG